VIFKPIGHTAKNLTIQSQVLAARLHGTRVDQIAKDMDLSVGQVQRYLRDALDRAGAINEAAANELRSTLFYRLEVAVESLMPAVLAGSLKAIDSLVRVTDLQARLGYVTAEKSEGNTQIVNFNVVEIVRPREQLAIEAADVIDIKPTHLDVVDGVATRVTEVVDGQDPL
jgi:hypothetical protein